MQTILEALEALDDLSQGVHRTHCQPGLSPPVKESGCTAMHHLEGAKIET